MPIVGDASIIVRAITTQVKRDIQKAFQDARPAVAAEGRAHGQEYGAGFHQGLSQGGGIGKIVDTSMKDAARTAGSAGSNAGSSFGDRFGKSVKSSIGGGALLAAGSAAGAEVEHGLESGFERAAPGFESGVTRSVTRAGGNAGDGFKRIITSKFAEAARSASKTFTSLIVAGNIIAPLVAQLVGGISSLVSGLFALGAAAAQAAGALAVLPGIMGVLLQSFGALKIAFSGVGGAISAGMKEATASTASTTASTVSATNAIADAQRALGRTTVSVAQANADAAGNVADAEREVLSAQQDVLSVQKELNDAREQAAEDLQQLSFSAEDAALSEQRAKLELKDAFAALQAVSNLPPNNRARIDAELAFKEAELNFREAKDRNNDLAKEQARAARAGIEGSQAVIDKKNEINDAQQRLADSEQALADARVQQARTAVQGEQQIADAQRAVAEAQQSAADALASGSTAASAYQTALAALSPAARDFVKSMVAMKGSVDDLKESVGEDLFPKLTVSVKEITTDVFPLLEKQLGDTGSLLGDAANEFTGVITSASGLSKLKTIMEDNNRTLSIFTKEGEDGDSAISELVKVILRLGVAIQPITHRFALWVKSLIDGADAATKGGKKMEALRGFFKRAGDTAAQLGDIFSNLFDALRNLAGAARPAGHGLLDSFEEATAKLKELTAQARKSGELGKFFKGAADNTRAIGTFLDSISLQFLQLGDNPGIRKFFDAIEPATDDIGSIADELIAAGPALAEFVNQFAELAKTLTQANTIKIMLTIFSTAFKVINTILNLPVVGFFVGLIVVVGTVTRSFAFMLRVLGFFGQAILGGPIALVTAFDKVKSGTGRVASAFKALKTDGVRAAFNELTAASDKVIVAFKAQMERDQLKIGMLKELELQADRTALAMGRLQKGGLPAATATTAVKPATALTSSQTRGAVPIVPTTATRLPRSESGSRPLPVFSTAVAAKSEKAIGRVTSATTKLSSGLTKARSGIGTLGKGILGFAGGPIGALLLAMPLIIIGFKKLYDSSALFRAVIDRIVSIFQNKAVIVGFAVVIGTLAAVMAAQAVATGIASGSIVAYITQSKLAAAATKIWTAVQFVFNAVMDANPIALTVIAIIALVAAIIIAYKKSETFRRIVNAALNAVKVAAETVFNFFKDHWKLLFVIITGPFGLAILLIVKYFDQIKDAITTAVSFVVDFVKDHWSLLLVGFLGPIALLLPTIIKHFDDIKAVFVDTFEIIANVVEVGVDIILVIWNVLSTVIVAVAKGIWTGIKLYFKLISAYVKLVFGAIKLVWQNVLKPVFEAIKAVVKFLWQNVIKPDLELIKKAWSTLWDAVKAVWQNVIKPVFDALKAVFDTLHDKVDTVLGFLLTRFNDVKTAFGNVRDFFKEKIQDIGEFFGNIPGFIRKAFGNLGSFAVDGINKFIGFLNDHLIGTLNAVTSQFGLTIDDIPVIGAAEGGAVGVGGLKRAQGGPVTGPGTSTSDSIPARLSAGEYVVKASSVKRVGIPAMHALNRGRADVAPYPQAVGFSSTGVISGRKGFTGAPMGGGRGGIIGDAFGWVKNTTGAALDQIKDWLRQGVGFAMKKIVEAFVTLLKSAGFAEPVDGKFDLSDGSFFVGVMEAFEDYVEAWGKGKESDLVAQVGSLIPGNLQGGVSLPLNAAQMAISGYGYQGQYPLHNGVDLAASFDSPVYAIADGILRTVISLADSYGRYIVGGFPGFDALYAHLLSFAPGVKSGAEVKAGQVLGWSDTSGNAFGAHLHFEVRKPGSSTTVDPLEFLRSLGLKFAAGGVVPATKRGTLGLIGEAGRPERIEPLDREGLSKRDKLILDTIRVAASSGGGGGDTFQVFPSQGMSEVELAESVSRRVSFKRRTGT